MDGAYTPDHVETVDVRRSFNMTKLKKFAKRGRVIQDIIDSARFVKSVSIKVQRRLSHA